MSKFTPEGPPRFLCGFAQSDIAGAEPQPVRSLIPPGVPPEEALSAFIEALSIDYGKPRNELIAWAIAADEAARQDLPLRTSVFRKGRSLKLHIEALKLERDENTEEQSLGRLLLWVKKARKLRSIVMPRHRGGGRPRRKDADWQEATGATFNQLAIAVSARLAAPNPTGMIGTCRDAILSFRKGIPLATLEAEARTLKEAMRPQRSLS